MALLTVGPELTGLNSKVGFFPNSNGANSNFKFENFENVKKFPGVANDIGNNFAKAIFQILMSFGLGKKDKFLNLTFRSEI